MMFEPNDYITSHLQCPDKPNITNNVVCTSCGGVGHISRDCRVKMQYDDSGNPIGMDDRNKIDEEVNRLNFFYYLLYVRSKSYAKDEIVLTTDVYVFLF
jgi:Zinc knuckle